jgi:hypothetical protein
MWKLEPTLRRERLLLYGGILLAIGVCSGVAIWGRGRPVRSYNPFVWEQPKKRIRLGPNNPPSPKSFQPRTLFDPFPVITNVPVVSADEADEDYKDSELVLGVVVDEKPRAYAINMLTQPTREIMNDTLGGRAIAATW